jgi:hypothetical protein
MRYRMFRLAGYSKVRHRLGTVIVKCETGQARWEPICPRRTFLACLARFLVSCQSPFATTCFQKLHTY